ncbi:MAG: hypothetical protein AAF921_03430 [Cyanobacteria bacterium P01_D01_bin.44]
MIDLLHPIALAEYPHLLIYPDLEDGSCYYAFAQPHLSLIDDVADMTLMTYQKQGIATGGQLSLTTTLGLSSAEQTAVVSALTSGKGSPPHLSYPDWTGGNVTVAIADILTLTGQPTLMSDNHCALSSPLTAEQAQAISNLWQSNEAWLTLHYEVQFVGWDVAETQTTSTTQQPGHSTCHSASVRQTTARPITQLLTRHLGDIDGKHIEIKL